MAKLWRKLKWLVFFLGHGVYVYLFLVTRLQVRPLDGFSRAMAQTTRSHARVCPQINPCCHGNDYWRHWCTYHI